MGRNSVRMRLFHMVPLFLLGNGRRCVSVSAFAFPASRYHSSSTTNKIERTKRKKRSIIPFHYTNNVKNGEPSVCNLFFRSTTDSENPNQRRQQSFDSNILTELGLSSLLLPYETKISTGDNPNETITLIIRHMESDDLNQVTDLCIAEFGSGPTTNLLDFPWNKPEQILEWWDRLWFEPSVRFALQAKMNANNNNNNNLNHNDPSILVLCRRGKERDNTEEVIGLVEVSLQPPEANRNPPTYPVPRRIKELYCRAKGIEKLEGWITNLLISPKYRGMGYSKMLMAATEGIARSWGCQYMYLHADADFRSGKVPQSLYENLGYAVITDEDQSYDWMPKSTFSSIRMVQGVALLWFGKQL